MWYPSGRNERSITDPVGVSPRDCFDLSILWPIDRLLGHDRYRSLRRKKSASLAVSLLSKLIQPEFLQTNMHIFIHRVPCIGETFREREHETSLTWKHRADPLSLFLSLSHRESSSRRRLINAPAALRVRTCEARREFVITTVFREIFALCDADSVRQPRRSSFPEQKDEAKVSRERKRERERERERESRPLPSRGRLVPCTNEQ